MWKWVTLLCVGMYGTLMLFGGEGYNPEESAAVATEPETEVVAPEAVSEPVVVEIPEVAVVEPEVVVPETIVVEPEVVTVTEPVEALPTATQPAAVEVTSSAIRPIAPVATPTPIREQLVSNDTAVIETVPAVAPTEIWRVTGTRVNLRAAATTQARIVGRTVRGDSAEIIELLPNGWAKVFIIDSGIEAYMSASFIAPEG
jgi:hypothetical protein